MKESFHAAYGCLDAVFRKKAFSGIELNTTLNSCPEKIKPLVTKLVYGVLDLNLRYEFVLEKFAKKIKPSVSTVLKIGLFAFEKLNVPQAVAVNETVSLAVGLGKGGISGFVNAVMRRATDALKEGHVDFGSAQPDAAAIANGFPIWAARLLAEDYGTETAVDIVSFSDMEGRGHIRLNPAAANAATLESALKAANVRYERSPVEGGYFVKGSLKGVSEKLYTFQSAGSMAVTLACASVGGQRFLDLCAAPGGKSVFLAQINPCAEVVACDLYPHRVALIEKYAHRMGVKNLITSVNDATEFRMEFSEAFECVLCDAPCSGFGVISSKPDIKLFRRQDDIDSLSVLQSRILAQAKKYVKVGGSLIYSTCTIFKRENGNVVAKFLEENKNFELAKIDLPFVRPDTDGTVQFLPHRDGLDGFFIARLKRNT